MPVIFLPYKKKPWICKFREPWSGRPRVRSFNSEQEALDFEKVQRLIFEREKALVRRARYKGRQPEKTLTVAELLSAYIEARQSLSTRTTAMQHCSDISKTPVESYSDSKETTNKFSDDIKALGEYFPQLASLLNKKV